jgi:hypothetical protein
MTRLVWELETPAKMFAGTYLPFIVLAGFFIVTARHVFTDGEPVRSLAGRILLQSYFMGVTAYLVWTLHLFLNVPPLIQPEENEILWIAGVGFLGILAVNLAHHYRELDSEADPRTQVCLRCKKTVLKIAAVCPFCNNPL